MFRGASLFLAGASLFLAAAPAWGATEVQARLIPPLVPPHGEVELFIEVRWEGFRGPKVDPSFELDNLEIVAGPRRTSATTFLSGPAAQGLTLTWRLRPKNLGPARVFNIRVRLDGTPYELPDCRIEARTDAPEPPPVPPGLADLGNLRTTPGRRSRPGPSPAGVFLRAEVSPRQPYVGQQTAYTLYIYYQSDVRNIRPREMPQFPGFWVREMEAGGHPAITLENGHEYSRSILLRRILYPLRSGELSITPTVAEMVVDTAARGERETRGELLHRKSNGVMVTVRELPPREDAAGEAAPGLVGALTATAELRPAQVTVGEAAEWILILQGTAYLRPLPTPTPQIPAGVRLLPPQTTHGEEVAGGVIHQLRRWRFPVVADRPGAVILPAVAFSYFDPREGRYRMARTAELTLEVREAAPASAAAPAAGTTARDGQGEGRGRWLLPLLAGLVLVLGVVLGVWWWRRRESGWRLSRRRLLEDLEAAAATASDRPRKAAAAMEAIWRQYLERQRYLPAGLPLMDWAAALARAGQRGRQRQRQERATAAAALVEELQLLAQAPQLADTAALAREVRRRSEALLRHLRP